MDNVRGFTRRLQTHMSAADEVWHYTINELPRTATTDAASLVKCITVVSSSSKEHISLSFRDFPKSRATSREPFHKFILLHFQDFRLREPKAPENRKVTFAAEMESVQYIARLLETGLLLNGIPYHFFGHSSSQLRSRSCIMFAGTKQEISAKIAAMGDFSAITPVGKKVKRIGLLFSTADVALHLPVERCEDIDDIILDGYNYTDGCGLISRTLARQIAQRGNIMFRNLRYLPSVFQIRYRGYKGVLAVSPLLERSILVQFRTSMRKFESSPDLSLGIVEYSKPYAFGYLNDEIVLLMSSLGIPTSTLLRKQSEYLDWLRRAYSGIPLDCFRFLSYVNEVKLAKTVLLDGPTSILERIQALVRRERNKILMKKKQTKCRIMIPKSRVLFGVCDPTHRDGQDGVLEPGTCFVRITAEGDGKASTIIDTEVLVTRNPCLHAGDLQKFKATDAPELAHLVDCIVFPTRGARPSADLMSGGDLDGDKFFVTWDPDIIPSVVAQPAFYPSVELRTTSSGDGEDDRIRYFAGFSTSSLAHTKTLHDQWARCKGILSPECQQLNRIYSQSLDGQNMPVPQPLQEPPTPQDESDPFVLDELHSDAERQIHADNESSECLADAPFEVIDLLLSRSTICVSEFDLIRTVLRWCSRNGAAFSDYVPFFDFGALNDEQQAWVLGALPPERKLPDLVRNGLHQSHLLERADLMRFQLENHAHHWKSVFDSRFDRMGRFSSAVCRSLELFHKKLIILRPDERLTVAIYVPQKVPKATAAQVDARVRVFTFPRFQDADSDNYRVVPTKVNYRLFCNDESFQLYENEKCNTFIYFHKAQLDKTTYNNIKRKGDRRRKKQETLDEGVNYDCRASIALNKISAGVQDHVGRLHRAGIASAEIYAISNRDFKSLQLLDEWSNLVDTQEVLPSFKREQRQYKIQTDTKRSRDEEAADTLQLPVDPMESLHSLCGLLRQLVFSKKCVTANRVFGHILDSSRSQESSLGALESASLVLQILPDAPDLIFPFFQSSLWQLHKEQLQSNLSGKITQLSRSLIETEHVFKSMMRESLRVIITELNELSKVDIVHVVELIALGIKDRMLALELLKECIEPEASRLLEGPSSTTVHYIRLIFEVVLEYVDQIRPCELSPQESVTLVNEGVHHGSNLVKSVLRIDSPLQHLREGDHVCLQVLGSPQDAPLQEPFAMHALVTLVEYGSATFSCLQQIPPYAADCAWTLIRLGNFRNTKAVLNAIVAFHDGRSNKEPLFSLIVACSWPERGAQRLEMPSPSIAPLALSRGQNVMLDAALNHPLSLIWAPPGTRKAPMIVMLLENLSRALPTDRVLVTAPTETAIQHLYGQYVGSTSHQASIAEPFITAPTIWRGLAHSPCIPTESMSLPNASLACSRPKECLSQSRVVFTTCSNAGTEIFKEEIFQIAVIDGASDTNEAASLIPLAKGCSRAILIGDHTDIGPQGKRHGSVVDSNGSLFERLFLMPTASGVAKVMLDVQYNVHSDICSFRSLAFYGGQLRSARQCDAISLPPSAFPWPPNRRMVFIQCSTMEDIGDASKCNKGQAEVCRKVYDLLARASLSNAHKRTASNGPKVALKTFYQSQKAYLQRTLPKVDTTCVEDLDNQAVDIMVLVTVRCNAHAALGKLNNPRQINAATSAAKAGIIIIGDRATLTSKGTADNDQKGKKVWSDLLDRCSEVYLPEQLPQ